MYESAHNYDNSEAKEFLQSLIALEYLEDAGLGITKKVVGEGYSSLSPKQRLAFKFQVEDEHISGKCKYCSDTIPWSEMLSASSNGGYCGHCEYMLAKIFAE